MKKILLIDANNIGYRSFIVMYENKKLLTNNLGTPTTVIFGLLRVVSALVEKYSVDSCVMCWDGGSKYRKKLFPHYKAHRGKPEWAEIYYKELDTTREYFEKLGIKQARIMGVECDDVIGYMTRKHTDAGDKVIIFSDDMDFFQLSRYGVKFYRPTKGELITKLEVEDKLGYPPNLFTRMCALTGQQSDNIPGIGDLSKDNIMQKVGLGVKTAYKMFCKPDGGFYKLKELLDALPQDNKFYGMIKKNWNQVRMSYKLARIRTDDKEYEDWELDELVDIFSNNAMPTEVKRNKVDMINKFLDFKTVNLVKMLKGMGVNVR